MTPSAPPHDPDLELIRRTARGDEEAFEELVEKHKRPLLNTVYRYIGDPEDAEDLAQEVFVKVWKNASGFKGRSKVSTWLYRIAVNACLNDRRKRKHRVESLDRMQESGRTPDALVAEEDRESAERNRIVREALSELPGRQRMALMLSRFEGRSYKEIAEIMDTSLSSVESLIFRAKEGLARRLLPLRERGEI
jgi:RNA polymerase sigma-70 factor (ECF subfamily)